MINRNDLIPLPSDEAATALNIYLSQVAATAKEKRHILLTSSYLIKAIKEGKPFPEESILFSLGAGNVYDTVASRKWSMTGERVKERRVRNAALPSPNRIHEPVGGFFRFEGDAFSLRPTCLDEAISIVGGPAVALRLIELSESSKTLAASTIILWESVKESWTASEDMERMRKLVLTL